MILSAAIGWRTDAVATTASASDVDPARAIRLIAALNDCIQERFRKVEERFGMSRIVRIGATPHVFRPEDTVETRAVGDLEAANLEVVLYVAGRTVQRPRVDTSRWSPADAWRLVKGPVAITRSSRSTGIAPRVAPDEPPASLDLWDEGRRAFQAFDTRDSHEFQMGSWRFIAKPVRASDVVCLTCHDGSVRLGDPLGVVLYGYRAR